MGWWGPGIFDGDPALDCYDRLARDIRLHRYAPADMPGGGGEPLAELPVHWDDRKRAAVRNAADLTADIAAWARRHGNLDDDDSVYATQVAAATLLAAGATIDCDLAAQAREACDRDPWAARNPARRQAIDQLRAGLDSHDGHTPVLINGRSIDEAFRLADEHGHRPVNLPGS